MEAMNTAGPKESIVSACARPEILAKVKTDLRTLLLSICGVPGTDWRKAELRCNGRGNNLFFDGPGFFAIPNFADMYTPLVKLRHAGPSENSPFFAGGASQLAEATSTLGFVAAAEPRMPAQRRTHEIVAADPRAQAFSADRIQ